MLTITPQSQPHLWKAAQVVIPPRRPLTQTASGSAETSLLVICACRACHDVRARPWLHGASHTGSAASLWSWPNTQCTSLRFTSGWTLNERLFLRDRKAACSRPVTQNYTYHCSCAGQHRPFGRHYISSVQDPQEPAGHQESPHDKSGWAGRQAGWHSKRLQRSQNIC